MSDEGTRPSVALDDPIDASLLLTLEEKQLLGAADQLGCELRILAPSGSALTGRPLDAETTAAVLAAQPETTPVHTRTPRGDFLGSSVFHDGERLCLIVCGPLDGEGRARALRTAHYLIRLSETLLIGALRRVLSTRIHLAHVEEAYCELQLKNQRLEQAIQRMKDSDGIKANFLATVSHELRTPLTSVIGYSEMLMEGLAGPLNEEQREYLETVMAKSDQLLALITKLLDVSRIESAGVQMHRSAVDLQDVVRDVLTTVAPHGRRKRLRVSASLPADLQHVDGDRDKLRQVLLNLVANAIKFTPDSGEVTIVARNLGAESLPSDPGPPRGPRVLVSVIDNGIGIPTNLHEKVFDSFYQVDNTSTREYAGSGLGLSIVRKFVDAHGGRVWVEDRDPPARGAVFCLTLPVASSTSAAVAPPHAVAQR